MKKIKSIFIALMVSFYSLVFGNTVFATSCDPSIFDREPTIWDKLLQITLIIYFIPLIGLAFLIVSSISYSKYKRLNDQLKTQQYFKKSLRAFRWMTYGIFLLSAQSLANLVAFRCASIAPGKTQFEAIFVAGAILGSCVIALVPFVISILVDNIIYKKTKNLWAVIFGTLTFWVIMYFTLIKFLFSTF